MITHEYTVKRIETDVYRVYKFEEGNTMPETNYTVTTYNSKFECNCMSGKYRAYCKHSTFVKEYRKLERKAAFKDSVHPLGMITFRK